MSRGLGALQRRIKTMLRLGPLRFADMRTVLLIERQHDAALFGEVIDKLRPARERSLRRALKGLVDRGDVLIAGAGGPSDPRRYMTVECFATITKGEQVKDSAEAKQIVADMGEAVAKIPSMLGI